MTRKGRNIISVVTAMLLVGLLVAANVWRRQSLVKDIRVEIDYCEADTLVSCRQVAALVRKQMPEISRQRLGDVDLKRVEQAAAKSPFLRNCQASTSIGGAVVVYAVQRRPVMHVCAQGQEFYVDDQGYRLPMSRAGACDVIVASGAVPPKGKWLKQVWNLAMYIDQHPDLRPLFDQIYRSPQGDLYLTPKLGSHVVQMGSDQDLDAKFHNLMALYSRGLSQAGWDTYRQVSVKYRGQIVCTKR